MLVIVDFKSRDLYSSCYILLATRGTMLPRALTLKSFIFFPAISLTKALSNAIVASSRVETVSPCKFLLLLRASLLKLAILKSSEKPAPTVAFDALTFLVLKYYFAITDSSIPFNTMNCLTSSTCLSSAGRCLFGALNWKYVLKSIFVLCLS